MPNPQPAPPLPAGAARRTARPLPAPALAVFLFALLLPLLAATAAPAAAGPGTDGDPTAEGQALHQLGGALLGFFLVTAGFASFLALILLIAAVAPAASGRIAEEFRAGQTRCFLLGLVNAVFLTLLMVVTHGKLAVLVFPALGFLLVLGLTGACDDLGRRVLALTRRDTDRLGRLAAGALVAFFASLVPVIGWFLILPYLALAGCGACVSWLVALRKSAPKPAASATGSGGATPAAPPPPVDAVAPGDPDAGVPPRAAGSGEVPPQPPPEIPPPYRP
ncbi:MAG: hypothetical protein HZA54_09690 [Planctomycetes bacterium]|nr:hypothetical protein [Planctomycetota bacterium]